MCENCMTKEEVIELITNNLTFEILQYGSLCIEVKLRFQGEILSMETIHLDHDH